MSLAAV